MESLKNKILERTDAYIVLELTQNQKTIIDIEDYEKIKYMKLYVYQDPKTKHEKRYYCIGNMKKDGKWVKIILARFLLHIDDPKVVVDHINHDTLDNRKSNLRACSHSQNCMNRKMNEKIKKVNFKGVIEDKITGKYIASIKVNGVNKNLGSFSSKNNAAIAYNKAAKKHFGEFSYINKDVFPEEENILHKNNTNGFIGVSIYKGKTKTTYKASLGRGKKYEYSGGFDNIIDAAKAYNEMAIKRYGEKAKLNKIEE